MSAVGGVVKGLGRFWRGLVVEPISRGRLRDTNWPVGLAPVVTVGVVAFCLAVLVILISPTIRELAPLTVSVSATVLSLPRLMLMTIFWLVILSLAFLQTAVIHTRRRTTIVVTTVSSLAILYIGALDFGIDGDGGFSVTAGKIASVVAVVVLVLLIAVRRRARFTWWEFPLVLSVVGGVAVIALGGSAAASAPFGLDFAPTAASLVMTSIGLLAVPAALAAGVAVAEFAVNAATSAVAALEKPRVRQAAASVATSIPVVLAVAFGLVVLWRIGELVAGASFAVGAVIDPGDIPLSLLIVGIIAALWWALARIRGTSRTGIDDVVSRLDDVGFPVAAALTITLAPVIVLLLAAQVLVAWGVDGNAIGGAFFVSDLLRGSEGQAIQRILVSVGLLIAAVLTARRGSRGVPELLATIAVVSLAGILPSIAGQAIGWSFEALAAIIAIGTLALTTVIAFRRQLDSRRLAMLTIALLLSAAAAWRDVLADPLSLVIGASGVALVLFGFVWGFVTDADITHHDSTAYPTPARVMLFLANSVFGVTVLAFGTLARDVGAAIDLDSFAQLGDELLGTALIMCAVMAVWAGTLERNSVDSPPPPRTVAA